jgi:uncharacterized protein YdhG (YjbR/CyaY superfamily)
VEHGFSGVDSDQQSTGFSAMGGFSWVARRPPTIEDYKKELASYRTTKATVSFSLGEPVPAVLVKKLAKRSIKVMKDRAKAK